MTSTSLASTSSTFSVHLIEGGTQSTRLPAMPRLKMCASSTRGTCPSQRIFVTDWPTVPNPSRLTRTASTVRDITLHTRSRVLPPAGHYRNEHHRGPPPRHRRQSPPLGGDGSPSVRTETRPLESLESPSHCLRSQSSR